MTRLLDIWVEAGKPQPATARVLLLELLSGAQWRRAAGGSCFLVLRPPRSCRHVRSRSEMIRYRPAPINCLAAWQGLRLDFGLQVRQCVASTDTPGEPLDAECLNPATGRQVACPASCMIVLFSASKLLVMGIDPRLLALA